MNKPKTLAAMAATALVGIIVPVALLMDGGGEDLEEQIYEKLNLVNELIPNLVSDNSIRSQYKQISCLANHYKGEIVWNTFSLSDTKFDGISNFSSDSTESCLLVEYQKQEYEGGKWEGEFRLIWSVKDGGRKQGLIAVTSAKTQNKQLLINSEAYAIKRFGTESNKWFVSYIQEVEESKKTKNALKKIIPKASSKFSEKLGAKDEYWGFFNPTSNKICGKGDCTKIKGGKIKNSYYWEFKGDRSGNETVHSWTSDITKWLEDIFDWKHLENKIKNVKGKWERKEVTPSIIEE